MLTPDAEIGVAPNDPSDVRFPLELEIGVRGDERRDIFQVYIATPAGLLRTPPVDQKVIRNRATIVLSEFSWPLLRRTLEKILNDCRDETWDRSLLKLQRYFEWEYEDFK